MKVYNRLLLIFLLGLFSIAISCGGVKSTAMKGAGPVLDDVAYAIFAQDDLELVKVGLPGNILLIEGLVRAAPEDYTMLVMAAKSFGGLAIIIEDEEPERATKLYRKGKAYGMRALMKHRGFRKAIEDGKPFHEAIKLIDDKKYVDAILWTGLCWGLDVMLNIEDPMVLVGAVDVKAIMLQLILIDDTYFYGMAHIFFGAYYAILPSIFSGGPTVVQKEFDTAFEISDGKFLLGKVFYAVYYATLTMDEELFDKTLNEVLDTPSDVLPEVALMNELAKKKARILLKKKDEMF